MLVLSRRVDERICVLPDIDWITIDAYKGNDSAIAELLCASTRDPERPGLGLAHLGKPLLVAEYGGRSGATAHRRRACGTRGPRSRPGRPWRRSGAPTA